MYELSAFINVMEIETVSMYFFVCITIIIEAFYTEHFNMCKYWLSPMTSMLKQYLLLASASMFFGAFLM